MRVVALLYGYGLVVAASTWLAATYSARRLAAAPLARPAKLRPHLIIAATGHLPDLERLRDALLVQTLRPDRITFAVEETIDPAFGRISTVFGACPLQVATVVAGLTESGGQKSHNLVAALRAVDQVSVPIVFADADIVPQSDWLAQLLRPIAKGTADIVTGYRWPVPLDARLPTLLATWIDRALAALPKPIGSHMIWGGSTALAPGVVDRIGLAERLAPELSDDLFLAALARAHRLRVLFQPAVLVPTPTRHCWRSLIAFGRRQYQMVRLYLPGGWLAWLVLTACNLLASLAAVALLFHGARGKAAFALLAGGAAAAYHARTALGRAAGAQSSGGRVERAVGWLALLLPLVHAVNLLLIVAALGARSVRWGRCTYRLKGRRIVAVERRPFGAPREIDQHDGRA